MIKGLQAALLSVALGAACADSGDAATIMQLGDMTAKPGELSTRIEHAAVDDYIYRRTYGSSDMKVHECARTETDGSIVGENCPSAYIVFGPYVFVPGNSNASLSIELQASSKLVVASDIVSSAAKNLHAALGDQELKAGETRSLTYKVHFFQPAEGVEARFWIRGDDPTSFKLRKIALDIR